MARKAKTAQPTEDSAMFGLPELADFIDFKGAANLLGCSYQTVCNYADDGVAMPGGGVIRLQSYRIGKRTRRTTKEACEQFIGATNMTLTQANEIVAPRARQPSEATQQLRERFKVG